MKDLLIGFFLGCWFKNKIDLEKIKSVERTSAAPEKTNDNPEGSHLAAGLWLVGVSLGIGLLASLIGWYLLVFICACTLIAGISLMLTPGALL